MQFGLLQRDPRGIELALGMLQQSQSQQWPGIGGMARCQALVGGHGFSALAIALLHVGQ